MIAAPPSPPPPWPPSTYIPTPPLPALRNPLPTTYTHLNVVKVEGIQHLLVEVVEHGLFVVGTLRWRLPRLGSRLGPSEVGVRVEQKTSSVAHCSEGGGGGGSRLQFRRLFSFQKGVTFYINYLLKITATKAFFFEKKSKLVLFFARKY